MTLPNPILNQPNQYNPVPNSKVDTNSYSGLATASFYLAISSLIFGVFTALPGLIFGIVAWDKARKEGTATFRAKFGTIWCSVVVGLFVLVIVIAFLVGFFSAMNDPNFTTQ